MHKTRLRMMIKMLENHEKIFKSPKRKEKVEFNISLWNCGSSACAVGSACVYAPFKRLGLRLNRYDIPEFKGKEGMQAVETFFGISTRKAAMLFTDEGYVPCFNVTAQQVADKIRKYIK